MNSTRLTASYMRGQYEELLSDYGEQITISTDVGTEDSFGRETYVSGTELITKAIWRDAEGDDLELNGGLLRKGDAVALLKSSISIEPNSNITLGTKRFKVVYIDVINCGGDILKEVGLQWEKSS